MIRLGLLFAFDFRTRSLVSIPGLPGFLLDPRSQRVCTAPLDYTSCAHISIDSMAVI